ncbi:MAG: CHAT domain-containing protein [Nonlabens ulvanivorans]
MLDLTGAVDDRGMAVAPNLDLPDDFFAGVTTIYNDPRIEAWVALARGKKYGELVSETESDLLSNDTHPLAAHIWSWAQYASGHLSMDKMPQMPESIAHILKPAALFHIYDVLDRPELEFTLAEKLIETADKNYVALMNMHWSAEAMGREDIAIATSKALIKAFPNDPMAGFLITEGDLISQRNDWIDWLEEDEEIANSVAGKTVRLQLSRMLDSTTEHFLFFQKMHEVLGDDIEVQKRLGYSFESLNRYEDALPHLVSAQFEFYRSSARNRATALAKMERNEEAKQVIRDKVELDTPAQFQEPELARRLIEVFRGGLNHGVAHEIAINALDEHSEYVPLIVEASKFFNADGLASEVPALVEPLLGAHPAHLHLHHQLMKAYNELEKYEQTLALFKQYRDAGGIPEDHMLNDVRGAYVGLERYDEAAAIYDLAVKWVPDELWLQVNTVWPLAKSGRYEEAYERAKFVASQRLDNAWTLARLVEYADEIGRMDDAIALLTNITKTHPYSEEEWVQLALSTDPIVVWNKAIIAAPGFAFPREALADAILEQDEQAFPDALNILNEGLNVITASSPEERIGLLRKRTAVLRKALKEGFYKEAELAQLAFDGLDEARELGMSERDFWQQISYTQEDLGITGTDRAIASVNRMRTADSFDDMRYAALSLVTRTTAAEESTTRLALYHFDKIMHRFPRKEKIYEHMVQYHAKWGGSSLTSIWATQKYEELTGDPLEQERAYAYANLGAKKRHYEIDYGRDDSIAQSSRYVNWFGQARKDAYERQPRIKSLDLEQGTITKVSEGGIEIERRYDPVFGNIRYVRIGGLFLEFDYDKFGFLTKISNNDGVQVEQFYHKMDNFGIDQRVSKIVSPDRGTFNFEYNERGLKTRIHLEGHGSILIAYDEQNEISSAENINEDGSEANNFYVSMIYQEVLNLVRVPGRVQRGDFNDLFKLNKDPEIEQLANMLVDAGDAEYGFALFDLVNLLVERVDFNPSYIATAESHIEQLFYDFYFDDDTVSRNLANLTSIISFHRLQLHVRPEGLPTELWGNWQDMLNWLYGFESGNVEVLQLATDIRQRIQSQPLKISGSEAWLDKSYLSNPSFWRRYSIHEMFPSEIAAEARIYDILIRSNGDVVAASNLGLSVLRKGYWEWFAFVEQDERFSRSVNIEDIDASSAIYALTEDATGNLWLGMAGGLGRIDESYELEIKYYRSGENGAPKGNIRAVSANENQLAFGGEGGVSTIELESLGISNFFEMSVQKIQTAETYSLVGGFLISGKDGLIYLKNGESQYLMEEQVTDAIYDEDDKKLIVLRGEKVLVADWDLKFAFDGKFSLAGGQESILATAPPYGLGKISTEGDDAVMVMTDRGISLSKSQSFENLVVPRADRPIPLRAASELDGRVFFATDEGVAAIEYGQMDVLFEDDRPHHLLTDSALGLTFIATGSSIDVISHQDGRRFLESYARVDASHLDQFSDGDLLSHDKHTIVRIEQGTTETYELFDVVQTGEDGEPEYAPVSSLVVSSDDAVWVTAGASVFRWKDGMSEPEVFSIYKDDLSFEANSQRLSKVVETLDGRILLVASDEGHLDYKGKGLDGGLFEFIDGNFRETSVDHSNSAWFISGYTQISESEAIVGTTSGFARYRNGVLEEFDQIDDPSYMALKKKRPALYLGTDGIDLGGGLWLFGSASGLVGYKDGNWIDIDRLNGMLPRYEFANYGARVIHAIEKDLAGRIYISTDFGLSIYDPLGAGPEGMLLSEGKQDLVFADAAREQFASVADILNNALPENSDGAKLIERLRESRKKIQKLEQQLSSSLKKEEQTEGNRKVERDMRKAKQRELAILSRIENENPALRDMVELKPLDLASFIDKLPEDIVVAQYLPTESALYINLVSRDGISVRKVEVGAKELLSRAILASTAAGSQASIVKEEVDASSLLPGKASLQSKISDLEIETNLTWLYDQLLRPIENSIGDEQALVISPAGPLSYLPFSALIRESGEGGPEYAVERFNMATAPTLYALLQIAQSPSSLAFSSVVFGDPDGTLPAARREAQEIASLLEEDDVILKIGEEASYTNLVDSTVDSRFLHLAMHGKLDHEAPFKSYLLLAGGKRMQLDEIMTLDLKEAELVFLSACETGIGRNGLEFRTIAHAFLHAGAPAVMATLWEVNDEATRIFATAFYTAKLDGFSNSQALAQAQKEMISRDDEYSKPGYWSGFSLFGKS